MHADVQLQLRSSWRPPTLEEGQAACVRRPVMTFAHSRSLSLVQYGAVVEMRDRSAFPAKLDRPLGRLPASCMTEHRHQL